MSELAEVVTEVEAAGVALLLNGNTVRIGCRKADLLDQVAEKISFLRAHRAEVTQLLRARAAIRAIRPHVKLVEWCPKEPPVAIETCALVVDVQRFIKSTLSQLRLALADSKRSVGWTVPQLIDRLKQVGVTVEVDP